MQCEQYGFNAPYKPAPRPFPCPVLLLLYIFSDIFLASSSSFTTSARSAFLFSANPGNTADQERTLRNLQPKHPVLRSQKLCKRDTLSAVASASSYAFPYVLAQSSELRVIASTLRKRWYGSQCFSVLWTTRVIILSMRRQICNSFGIRRHFWLWHTHLFSSTFESPPKVTSFLLEYLYLCWEHVELCRSLQQLMTVLTQISSKYRPHFRVRYIQYLQIHLQRFAVWLYIAHLGCYNSKPLMQAN